MQGTMMRDLMFAALAMGIAMPAVAQVPAGKACVIELMSPDEQKAAADQAFAGATQTDAFLSSARRCAKAGRWSDPMVDQAIMHNVGMLMRNRILTESPLSDDDQASFAAFVDALPLDMMESFARMEPQGFQDFADALNGTKFRTRDDAHKYMVRYTAAHAMVRVHGARFDALAAVQP